MYPPLSRQLIIAAILVAILIACILRARDSEGRARQRTLTVIPHASSSQRQSQSKRAMIVDVGGSVRRPGVYALPDGARVLDALERAGGVLPTADLALLNRAAKVVDGQQIVVAQRAVKGIAVDGATATAATPGIATVHVSINAADADALDALQGIGPVTAQHIIDDRVRNGPFASIDDLDRVPGVGAATIDAIRAQVTL